MSLLRFSIVIYVFLGAWTSMQARAACTPHTPVSRPEITTSPVPYAYMLSRAKWPTKNIKVCWDNPSKNIITSEGMAISQEAQKETWEKYSGVEFVGWGTCAALNAGIRITIIDSALVGPRTVKLGAEMERLNTPDQYKPANMILNFTFKNWSTSNCSKEENRKHCIRSIAIHEFGHAIGLAHEHNRDDALRLCKYPHDGPDGDTKIGNIPDINSVMYYCKSIYIKNLQLSQGDIEAVRKYYGDECSKLPVKE